jgi:hypothetical protein
MQKRQTGKLRANAFVTFAQIENQIVYDTAARKKWAPSIARHRIGIIINDVLGEDWEEDRAVPEAVAYDDCEVS